MSRFMIVRIPVALVIRISPSDSDLALLSKPFSIGNEIFRKVHLHRKDGQLF